MIKFKLLQNLIFETNDKTKLPKDSKLRNM